MSAPPALHFETCTGVVIAYDPVRRKGLLRLERAGSHRGVPFALNMLPEPLHSEVVEASKKLNNIRAGKLPEEQFLPTRAALKQMLIGQRFRLEVATLAKRKTKIKRHSLELLPDAAR